MKVCIRGGGLGKASSFDALIEKEYKSPDGYKAPTMKSNIKKGRGKWA